MVNKAPPKSVTQRVFSFNCSREYASNVVHYPNLVTPVEKRTPPEWPQWEHSSQGCYNSGVSGITAKCFPENWPRKRERCSVPWHKSKLASCAVQPGNHQTNGTTERKANQNEGLKSQLPSSTSHISSAEWTPEANGSHMQMWKVSTIPEVLGGHNQQRTLLTPHTRVFAWGKNGKDLKRIWNLQILLKWGWCYCVLWKNGKRDLQIIFHDPNTLRVAALHKMPISLPKWIQGAAV